MGNGGRHFGWSSALVPSRLGLDPAPNPLLNHLIKNVGKKGCPKESFEKTFGLTVTEGAPDAYWLASSVRQEASSLTEA